MLNVPKNNPFDKYLSPNSKLSFVNFGKWYHKAQDYCFNQENNCLCPIIFGYNETLIGSHFERKGITLLIFTLSTFSQKLRNKLSLWKFLGFIYDLNIYSKRLVTTSQATNQQEKKKHLNVEKNQQNFTKY